ncbi:low-affinity Zn(2+) transporter zrt2 [Exophiala xenobiotica]|uniref:Low-affinity Zn(2+) transporter zrt2 n=1 Tax=Vermiconidia calcicola TaxID=1690605 RepID=A0AAV9Q6B5_9PEZI|nr:low-affinity Zn(2+) transporter zrt2 [Exophiala xenobiotica]KAK5533174.1 low-affinity Zn(2+) transporter zrt2 [Chaetothyriales sp. CCFEE 6169]KAK5536797.1 low-affinity Zn(2+) transporter zrt2 [Vermiconidia calcicola]KAK5264536.1 low-affinity Zn(2+) transporter zrt2 [Exophiala xenobiotica]KAK5293454.1 low-affinity Zn(2+) transporter zrt2 [Exophiala xenobiotica]
MATLGSLAHLVARQEQDIAPTCDTGNEYDGRIGLRVAALFIIWITSSIGATFPIFAKRHAGLKVPEWVFFICKYFGSGVIIATAFIHLLGPAEDALRNPCLTGPITEYTWVEGIVLMTIFVLFFVELMVMRYGNFTGGHSHDHSHADTELTSTSETFKDTPSASTLPAQPHSTTLGEDHLGHAREHNDIETANNPSSLEDYKAQMTAIFILEFGIIFHSVFIGLTLAVAGEEFDTLFIVIIFHQMFEGLGLGSRLAVAPWPKGRKWTPYLLGLAYGLSTPLAIAIGLGIRKSYPPGSQTTLIVNGVFDSISAGILIYTGLVELLAHEFLFQQNFANAKIQTVLSAFATMVCGAALMALLGKWA